MSPPERQIIKKDGQWTVDGRPRETFTLLSHEHPIPGKSQITLLITLPPNGASPPHTHNGASALGLMIRGTSLQQMNCDEPKIYKEGDTWYEAPGCHHVRSENVGEEGEEVRFFAVLVVDDGVLERDGYEGLLVLDKDREGEREGKGE